MNRMDALKTYINFARLMVQRDRRIYRETMMSKLQHVASRAPDVIAALEARAEKLDARLTRLDQKGHATFDKWDIHLDQADKAMAEAENAINQLSNAGPPLDDSPTPFQPPGAGNGAT